MQFRTQAGGILQFSADAEDVLESFRQLRSENPESGGLLLGRILLNNRDLIIDRVTPPTKDDTASRFFFFRPLKLAQRIVVTAWRRSRRTQNYLGDWHSHPEDHPTPSPKDIANWQRIKSRSKVSTDELFFVIVGRQVIKVWSIFENNLEPHELDRLPAEHKGIDPIHV